MALLEALLVLYKTPQTLDVTVYIVITIKYKQQIEIHVGIFTLNETKINKKENLILSTESTQLCSH